MGLTKVYCQPANPWHHIPMQHTPAFLYYQLPRKEEFGWWHRSAAVRCYAHSQMAGAARDLQSNASSLVAWHASILTTCLQVGADRIMRFWDLSGACVAEVHTGHKLGETVVALAIDRANARAVTGDSAGFIKVSVPMCSYFSAFHCGWISIQLLLVQEQLNGK